jgi:hypothetical protein
MLIEIHASVRTVMGLAERHDKTLYGNGQPGICSRFQVLETKYRMISKWSIAIVATVSTITGGIIGTFAGSAIKKIFG